MSESRLASLEDLADLLDIDFSAEQRAAIGAPLAPGVIIAGAGTGKTTVMAARVVWLVGTGQVRPDEVLGLTFTRKAAHELSQRVERALTKAGLLAAEVDGGRPTIATYDSFAGQLVAEHGLRIGAEADLRLITGAVRHRLAAQVVNDWSGRLEFLARLQPATIIERVLKLDGELRAHLVNPAQVQAHDRDFELELAGVPSYRGGPTAAVRTAFETVGARGELLELVARYRRLKAEHGLVEFADQMAQAAELVAAAPQVAQALRSQHRVVLLDEYQDTSSAQALLLRGLFSGPDASQGRGHAVSAVGDPFQAIYGWRGAAPSNILQFGTDFPAADGSPAVSYALTVNRRSRPRILTAANQLSAPLRADEKLRGPGADAAAGILHAPNASAGGELRAASFNTWPEEVAWLAEQVVAAHATGAVPRWSEIAVLTRQNAPISVIYSELSARGVPVEIVGLGGLLELPEIAEVVSTLRLIDDVNANPDALRLLSGPRWRLGPRDLAALGRRAAELAAQLRPPVPEVAPDPLGHAVADRDASEQLCLLDAVDDPGEAPISAAGRERMAWFAAELRRLRRHRDAPLLELVGKVIEAIGIGTELDSDPDWFAAQRSQQLTRFVDAVAGYVDIDGDGALTGLLAWLQAELEQAEGLDQATPSSADSVKLLTVHRAKGLEWDLVFLPQLCERVFPSAQAPDNWTTQAQVLPAGLRGDGAWVPQLAEASTAGLKTEYPAALRDAQRAAEDRLSYVAVTRARHTLIASCHHWFPGRVRMRQASGYFEVLAELATAAGQPVNLVTPSEQNPLLDAQVAMPWPPPDDLRRREAWLRAANLVERAAADEPDPAAAPGLDEQQQRGRWHQLAVGLVAEARARRSGRTEVVLPASLPASALLVANRDPDGFADQLLRPMPRPVSRQAGVGTRFHQWLETRFGPAALFDDPEAFDAGAEEQYDASTSDRQLARLIASFDQGKYAQRVPLVIEEAFIATIADHQVRGRIDAVFATPDDPDHDFQVVDWKTSNQPADPLQLAIYRYAWAASSGVPIERVDAVFYHVLADEIERPEGLLDAAGLTRFFTGLIGGGANLVS